MSFFENHEGLAQILMLIAIFAICLVIVKVTEKHPHGYFECYQCDTEVEGTAKYFDEDDNPLCADCYIKLYLDEEE